jgi:Leucine-rich repeat (LRR) protein
VSLRGLIILVLVIGAGLGWMVRSAHIQRDAVAAIERAGRWVGYDWERGDTSDIPTGPTWAPRWLVNLIGVDYFGHVYVVGLFPSSMTAGAVAPDAGTDAVMVTVAGLTRLQLLYLSQSSISDAGLKHLRGLTELRSLSLSGARISDTGLAHLKGVTELSQLDLGSTQVTDRGLAHLKGLTKLSGLDLHGTQVTDAGLTHLKGLTSLRQISLGGTLVTDAGEKKLRQTLPSLKIFR